MFETVTVSAVAASVGVILVAVFALATITYYLIRERRRRAHQESPLPSTPVIDLSPHINAVKHVQVAEPRQPSEAYFSFHRPARDMRAVVRRDDVSWQTELADPFAPAKCSLDLEAQSWKSVEAHKIPKDALSPSPAYTSFSLEASEFPPPSYSQIDKSPLAV
ncbi:hypothetical protein BC834DRAFT_401864 [Gloeopeniophorella convolvens]|nr:hypothetical protein BC834DRAFT_401864 [Gloeopeniophorella convolvens]